MENFKANVPQEVDEYTICEEIGRGTFSCVHRCIYKPSHMQCVVKVIPKELITNEADYDLICREVHVLSSLSHPNIVRYFLFTEDNLNFYIFMELCMGRTLLDKLNQEGKLVDDQVRPIFGQLASAISYLHNRGIAHRDLKLENVIVDNTNKVKIIDFGLSNYIEENQLLTTYCGSLHYASPEVIMQRPYEGEKTDIWSLGVMLYSMLVGVLPWPLDNVNNMISAIMSGHYVIPAFMNPDAANLIKNMLNINSDMRATIEQVEKSNYLEPYFKTIQQTTIAVRIPLRIKTNRSNLCQTQLAASSMLPSVNPFKSAPAIIKKNQIATPHRKKQFLIHGFPSTDNLASPKFVRRDIRTRARSFDSAQSLEEFNERLSPIRAPIRESFLSTHTLLDN